MDDPLVDEYNYETINEEYFTPLPYEDVNYNEEVDPQGGLTENAVEAELPTSTVITYNETDVILMNAFSFCFFSLYEFWYFIALRAKEMWTIHMVNL